MLRNLRQEYIRRLTSSLQGATMMVLGLLTALMTFTHWYPSVLVIWALRGGTDVLFLISAYSMTQLIVPNALLGRVITFTRVLTWPTGALPA